MSTKEIESIINDFPKQRHRAQTASPVKSTQRLKEEIVPNSVRSVPETGSRGTSHRSFCEATFLAHRHPRKRKSQIICLRNTDVKAPRRKVSNPKATMYLSKELHSGTEWDPPPAARLVPAWVIGECKHAARQRDAGPRLMRDVHDGRLRVPEAHPSLLSQGPDSASSIRQFGVVPVLTTATCGPLRTARFVSLGSAPRDGCHVFDFVTAASLSPTSKVRDF